MSASKDSDHKDSPEAAVRPSPEESARWYMFVAVFWLTSLVKKAAKAPLQTDDLFQLHPVFHAHNATKRIKSVMEAHVQETIGEPTKETSRETGESVTLSPKEIALRWGLLRGIFHSEGRKIFFAVLLHFMHLIAQMLAPLLLSMLLNAESRSIRAYFLAVGIFLAQMAQALGWNNSQYFSQGCAMSVKAALISMTQQKALRLGTNGRTKYPSGVIMNLIATDCEVIADSMQYLTDVICVPFEILSLSVLIIVFAGGAGAAGLAFMVLSSICAVYISSMRIAIEKKALAATDERVKVSGEVLNGIKIVKFFAWETAFSERLTLLREEEIRHIFVIRMITTAFAVTMNIVPSFVNAITFSIYAALGNDISAANIFSILSVINLIKLPIAVAPNITQMIFTSFVSLTRLAKFFAAEEIETPVDTVEDISSKVALKSVIKFENANFNWSDAATVEISEEWRTSDSIGVSEAITETEARKDAFGLKNLNINIRKGSLTLVCGKVGSGKSSLLQAIIGDMIGSGGSAKVFGKIGYCPQQYWLQNISLRENVLFGFPFDETRYNEVIQCCGLSKDLEILPFRDMSVIGDKGVTLSGGQAARVNLARAVYSDADILLLDDPLSAVDSHVGKHILEQCILHYCHDKTVILVSHHLHVAHYADHIIVMDGGEISEQGSFAELIAAENKFKTLMEEFGSHRTSDKEDKGDNITQAKVPTGDTLKESDAKGDDIDEDEERETGKVSLKYFRYYFENTGSLTFIGFLLFVLILWQIVSLFASLWLTFWVDNTFAKSTLFYTVALFLLAFLMGILNGFATVYFARSCYKSSQSMHDKMLASILKAPMIFFETNPAGRILSRFSRDFTETDRRLPFLFQAVVEMFLNILGTFILVAYASPFMLIVIVLIVPVYSYVLNLYRSCLRELKRIEAVSRSPLYSQINEILTGISTIRAFGVSDRFISISQGLQDNANRPTYIMSCLDIWIATRAESFVGIVIGMMAILGVALDIDLSLLGLALSYCLSAMFLLNFGLRHAAEVEARMNAVERLYHYANELPAEYTAGVSQKVANEWPVAGNISFRNLSIKYRPELPLILHSLNFDVPAGKKVGIVGRTGAGKSSIITAIFRLVEFAEGTIFIDDVDISNLELNDLRKKLAIIPQAPVLFDGTFRTNLDPFNNYKDEELWAVLHRCALHDYVSSLAEKLESRISEGGANLSMGQRQLLCLGRAMLIKSKILLIDEATASVDVETDSFIQKVIRADFSDCTVICIAHRLNTLMDYDSVLVMDNGRAVEVSDNWVELLKLTVTAQYDSPKVLASNPTSLFSALIDETGPANAAVLRRLALE